MSGTEFRHDNHYVAREYLKRWSFDSCQLWTYRLLVPHQNVPLWKTHSTKSIAYRSHLYTRIVAGVESDEIERWFESEYEKPTEEALHKATSDQRLTPSDWRALALYVAAQYVRTPARLTEHMERWATDLQPLMRETLSSSARKLEALASRGESVPSSQSPFAEYLPLRISRESGPGVDKATIKAETIAGRGLWIFWMKTLLTTTA